MRAEEYPVSALYRMVLGFSIIPLSGEFFGATGSPFKFILFFLGILCLLRLLPATARHLLPFSAEAQAAWTRKRQLAKRYDSYQWQKLFWIGLGLAAYGAFTKKFSTPEMLLTIACLVTGGIGIALWHNLVTPGFGKAKTRI